MESLGHIYVIDDDASMRTSLVRMLKNCGYSCDGYDSAQAFLDQSVPVSPAAILLDMKMAHMSGAELQEHLHSLDIKTPIVMISGESSPYEIVKSMKLGAVDFLFKPFSLDDLLKALSVAIEKDKQQLVKLNQTLSVTQRYESLTPREREVCGLLVDGLMSKDIALQLGTSTATIKVHKARVMEKMQAESLQELVKLLAIVSE